MPLHVLCIGAHPDDSELALGGTAALYRRRGDTVVFVSLTNGDRGHYAQEYITEPGRLALRRQAEAVRASRAIGAEYQSLGIPDGEVYVTRENTEALIRLIRASGQAHKGADIVFLPRPSDYHRDHRYTAQLVLDASYMLTVPMYCPDARHLARMPVFAYVHDNFTEGGGPFRADVGVNIDAAIEQKIDMIAAHESQMFEWLPFNRGELDKVPEGAQDRREWVGQRCRERAERIRSDYASLLPESTKYAEVFQISQYGLQPTAGELARLFPA